MDIKTFLELLALTADHFNSEWRIEKRENGDLQIRLTTRNGVIHCPATAVATIDTAINLDIDDTLGTIATALDMDVKTVDHITRSADNYFYLKPVKAPYVKLRKQMLETVGLEEPSTHE